MFEDVKTPVYIIDKDALEENLKILNNVSQRTGCKILLAQKAYSNYITYPLIKKYINGTTASSLHEAKLGYEEMGGETHIFAPAYLDEEFDEINSICDHIVFNSFAQWDKYKSKVKDTKCGIRVNPEYSEIEADIYNPCFANSRLGITLDNFKQDDLQGISGLHFHAMCEQNADTLKRILDVFEEKFGKYLYDMEWVNFGGGHHITRKDYDIDLLCQCITHIKEKYSVQVYLEPGEAVALNAGYLVSSVLDIVNNGMNIAILDASAACHMPDVIEMPYRPNVIGDKKDGKYTYRFGGNTCLAGDIIGDYSFDKPLQVGDKVTFLDMAIYSTVKNNTFNGIRLPDIATYSKAEGVKIHKTFSYSDFKERL